MKKNRGQNVFDFLDRVRQRPSMFVRKDYSLFDLEMLVHGYYSALFTHGLVEEVPEMNRHFLSWLEYRTRWCSACGWAHAINSRHPVPDDAFAIFFRFVDEYRLLRPERLCTVLLGPAHNPTGRRVVYGMNGRLEKPRRVDVFRYQPKPLHFLRLHYADRIENEDLLMTKAGKYSTDLDYAMQWVLDELQVDFGSWKMVDKKARKTKE